MCVNLCFTFVVSEANDRRLESLQNRAGVAPLSFLVLAFSTVRDTLCVKLGCKAGKEAQPVRDFSIHKHSTAGSLKKINKIKLANGKRKEWKRMLSCNYKGDWDTGQKEASQNSHATVVYSFCQ